MAANELELDFPVTCIVWTVALQSNSKQDIYSSEFQFKGAGWRLNYYYNPGDVGRYGFYLQNCSGVPPDRFHVSVQVRSVGTERIVTELSQETLFTDAFRELPDECISTKREEEILRALPEFRQNRVLQLFVLLKLEALTEIETETLTRTVTKTLTRILNFIFDPWCWIRVGDVGILEAYFAQLMDQGSDPDVEFRFGDEPFKAHGAVVCARSPVIAAMMASDAVEGKTRIVNIPDITPSVFQSFLRYIYTGKMPELSPTDELSLCECARKFMVPRLSTMFLEERRP